MSVAVLTSADLVKVAGQKAQRGPVRTCLETSQWNPGDFGWEQIRGLVRQVFFSPNVQKVRQVVFCAAESRTEIGSICWQVAETLALNTVGNVAVASRNRPPSLGKACMEEDAAGAAGDGTPRCAGATRIHRNLWLVPRIGPLGDGRVLGTTLSSHQDELRREFEYSIVQGPAGNPSEAAALGQVADGIVLVLAAHVTRRAIAVRIKQTLESAHVRLLGTVLSERRFPIPEAIYRRL